MAILTQQAPTKSATSLLRVNSAIFADLVKIDDLNYTFRFQFSVLTSNKNFHIDAKDSVKVTVKNQTEPPVQLGTQGLPIQTQNALSELTNAINTLNSTKLDIKINSGLMIVNDIEKSETVLATTKIPLSSYVVDIDNNYTITEIHELDPHPARRTARTHNNSTSFNDGGNDGIPAIKYNSDKIDPSDTLVRINEELCDITTPATDSYSTSLTSESLLDDIKPDFLKKGYSPLFFDITKYYIDDIPDAPFHSKITWYDKKVVTKKLDHVDAFCVMSIPRINDHATLIVSFDMIKKNGAISETVTLNLNLTDHIEAFKAIKHAPVVSCPPVQWYAGSSFSSNSHFLQANCHQEDSSKIFGYNIYIKKIDQNGSTTKYTRITKIQATGHTKKIEFIFARKSPLEIIRVVPIDDHGNEASVFTNVVIGPGHDSIGALTISPRHFGKNNVEIEVYNVPKGVIALALFRRDCTQNENEQFEALTTVYPTSVSVNMTIADDTAKIGSTYEYYVMAWVASRYSRVYKFPISNYVMFKNTTAVGNENSINVIMSDFTSTLEGTNYNNSFLLKTSTTSITENRRITDELKTQLPELYAQFLDPANNTESPLGNAQPGIPEYADLYLHEIIRTNLNTAEREIFGLVSDGTFIDGAETQKSSNVKQINPQHSYEYDVFTFRKNPLELFKKFVARGVNSKGIEWFYLPYKWLNPKAKQGYLYSDDKFGIPVIDAYESFTSDAFGLTASHRVDGSTSYASLSQILIKRVDRGTVRITWDYSGSSSYDKLDIYDSFIVMKDVNGIRSFVGRTQSDHIYHKLTSSDIGSIYYIIIPIMSEFDIDKPGYSTQIIIRPDSITPKIKAMTSSRQISV